MRPRRAIILIALWLVVILGAACFDASIARLIHDSGFDADLKSRKVLCAVLKTPGEYWFAVVCAVAVYLIRSRDWRSAVFIILATAMSGINGFVKWLAGRTRPYKLFDDLGQAVLAPFQLTPFRGGLPGLFQSKNLCFPSGHACMAFAVAESLAILFPRARFAFYGVASITAIERFAENAHYLSDCVAGAAIAIAGVHLIRWLWFSIVLKQSQSGSNRPHGLGSV
jgi:membrane-associated phospholipid phosphatase